MGAREEADPQPVATSCVETLMPTSEHSSARDGEEQGETSEAAIVTVTPRPCEAVAAHLLSLVSRSSVSREVRAALRAERDRSGSRKSTHLGDPHVDGMSCLGLRWGIFFVAPTWPAGEQRTASSSRPPAADADVARPPVPSRSTSLQR